MGEEVSLEFISLHNLSQEAGYTEQVASVDQNSWTKSRTLISHLTKVAIDGETMITSDDLDERLINRKPVLRQLHTANHRGKGCVRWSEIISCAPCAFSIEMLRLQYK